MNSRVEWSRGMSSRFDEFRSRTLEVSLEKTESKIEDSSSLKEKECVNASATCSSMEVSPEKSDMTIEDQVISYYMYTAPRFSDHLSSDHLLIGEDEWPGVQDDEYLKLLNELTDEKGHFVEPSPDEERERRRQWAVSEGFDVTIRGSMINSFIPYPNLDKVPEYHRQVAESCGKEAIDYYNKNQNEKMEFVRLLRVNIEQVDGKIYYLTFEAKDVNSPTALEFQAKVWRKLSDEREVWICRKKACPDQSIQGDV